jgi:hypothetical protein
MGLPPSRRHAQGEEAGVMTNHQDVEVVFAKAECHRETWRKKISIDYTRRSVPAASIMNGIISKMTKNAESPAPLQRRASVK